MASKCKSVPIEEWNEYQKELQSLRGGKLSYDSITDALNTELQSLRDQLHAKESNCKTYADSNAEMRGTFADVNSKYEKLMAEKSELLATITEQKAKCCNLQNSNQSFQKQNHRLQTQNDQFTEEVRSLYPFPFQILAPNHQSVHIRWSISHSVSPFSVFFDFAMYRVSDCKHS